MMPFAAPSFPRYSFSRDHRCQGGGGATTAGGFQMKRMAALLGVMGLMAAMVPATSGAKLIKKPTRCGGEHYLTLPLTQTKIPFPYC
jgi:hypothetical protein